MGFSWLHRTEALTLCAFLFVGMLLVFFIGRRVRHFTRFAKADSTSGSSPLTAAIFAMFGFILAFSFGFSGNRFESVRSTFAHEATTISTAILSSDLYPDSLRLAFRHDFKDYVEALILRYQDPSDLELIKQAKE